MLYLALHFAWYLLAAFAIGLVFGWLGGRGGLRGLFSGAPLFGGLIWLGAGALVWGRIVNNEAAFWVETGLLYLAAYVAGCCVASLLKGEEARPTAEAALALPAPRLALPGPAREATPASPSGPALIAGPATMPKVEGEDLIEGLRPAGFVTARGGVADDLKLIKGIGRQNEGRLHGLGIWHFDQIAAWTPDNVRWIGGYLAFPGRIEREDWVAQAATLASGGETEFAKRAKAGLVETSRDDGERGQGNVADMVDDAFEGDRPANLLPAPRGGRPDDLAAIDGIGAAFAERLNELGLWHFDQIAALSDAELGFVSHMLGAPGRGIEQDWRGQARALAEAK